MYIVYHDEASQREAEHIAASFSDWIIPIKLQNGKYMESEVFHDLQQREHEWGHADYIGILKHSFMAKTPFYDFKELVARYSQHDVFTFVNGQEHNHKNLPMIISAAWSHPLFHVIWYHLLSQMGFSVTQMFTQHIPGFYSNFWIAKRSFFQKYLAFFEHARFLMDTDTYLHQLLFQNASYEHSKLAVQQHMNIAGVPHPTYHCFIAERLACLFFFHSGASIFPVGGVSRTIDTTIPLLHVLPPHSS